MANDKIMSDFKHALRKEGLKITPQRISVLEQIINGEGHLESEDIYMAINARKIHVSRATVYRTLDILVQNGFARKLNLGDGRSRYESKVDSPHHDHMICTDCGKIIEFVNYEIEKIQEEIAKKQQFKMQKHIHQLFGICKECQ